MRLMQPLSTQVVHKLADTACMPLAICTGAMSNRSRQRGGRLTAVAVVLALVSEQQLSAHGHGCPAETPRFNLISMVSVSSALGVHPDILPLVSLTRSFTPPLTSPSECGLLLRMWVVASAHG